MNPNNFENQKSLKNAGIYKWNEVYEVRIKNKDDTVVSKLFRVVKIEEEEKGEVKIHGILSDTTSLSDPNQAPASYTVAELNAINKNLGR